MKFKLAELIQYLFPPDAFGPSLNTCPKCTLSCEHLTSVLDIPCVLSTISYTGAPSRGFEKLGHPVPESNLSYELNK